MDKLTAYRILGLEANASREQVKSAYAALSKQYHPEEYPEEFQRLHEAYKTLSRTSRQSSSYEEPAYTEPAYTEPKSTEYRTKQPEAEASERSWNFHGISSASEDTKEKDAYDFDKVLEDADSQERAQMHETALKALAEIHILLSPSYCEKLKLFETFFQKTEYQTILKSPEFMQEFAKMLEQSTLKKSIYNYIIDFYRLRGLDPQELLPSAAALYHVLDQKCGMKRSNRLIFYVGLPAGIIAGLRSSFVSIGHQNATIGIVVLLLAAVLLTVWAYRKLHENHSAIFSQAILAGSLLVLQFIVLLTDTYPAIFPNEDDGFFIAGLVILGCLIWLGILLIVTIFKKIIRKNRHNS